MTGACQWRPMAAGDLDGVVAVARIAFPDHFESHACFAERLALYPRGCFVLEADEAPISGYLIAYPWLRASAPALGSLIHELPARPEILYLHDLALRPEARGLGRTAPIIDRLLRQAHDDGWPEIALVAVNHAAEFWRRAGFEAAGDAAMTAKLASYGDDAVYMVRAIASRDASG